MQASPTSSHSPSSPRPRRPCDRCHGIKEKCRWASEMAAICDRCQHLQTECRTLRPVRRAGRRPRLASGDGMALRRRYLAVQPTRTHSRHGASPTDAGLASSPPPHGPVVAAPNTRPARVELYQRVLLFPELSRLEMQLLDATLHKQMHVDKYIIGPSFRDQHLQAFADHLDAGLLYVKDAFIACASVLVEDQQLRRLAKGQQIGFRRAAAAVASLRASTVTVHGDDDLSVMLILGVAMVTFAFHYRGGAPEPLCSYILALVKSCCRDGQSLQRRLGDNGIAFMVCLLGTETESCLIKCEVPTLQIRHYHVGLCVDRFIGVSLPMLAYSYDVCELAQRIRAKRCKKRAPLDLEELETPLKQLQSAIEKWQPAVPPDFLTGRFAPAEVTLMLAQSKVLRLTALLILHRLQYAYGRHDEKATSISCTILSELETALCLTGRSVPFAEMPHLAASLEVTRQEDRDHQLAKSDRIVDFSPFVSMEHKGCLVAFWAARDRLGTTQSIYWDDVQTHIQATV